MSGFKQAINHSNVHNSYINSHLKTRVRIHVYPTHTIPVVNNNFFLENHVMSISTLFRNATNVVPVVENPHSAVITRHMSAPN